MNDRLTQTARTIEGLARKHGATDACAITGALLERPGRCVIVANDLAAAGAFRDAVLPEGEVLGPGDLTASPAAALTASTLVAVFPCGQYLSADDVSMVELTFFSRPVGTYAFVFTGVNGVDAAELDLTERSAWRLLVPEPKPRWANQDLTEYGIYMWDSAGGEEESAARSAQTADAIRLLGRNDGVRDTVAAQALGTAIRMIRQMLESRAKFASATETEPKRFRDAQQDMRALRRRLVRNAETEVLVFSRTLDTSVMRLRTDLLSGLSGALRKRPARSLSAPARSELRKNLQEYLSSAVNQWFASTKAQMSTGLNEVVSDACRTLRITDWTAMNRAAEILGKSGDWPNRVIDRVSTSYGAAPGEAAYGPYGSEPNPQTPHPGFALGGAGVLMTLGWMAGPIPAVVTSILLGAAGWRVYLEGGIREYEQYGRGIILGATEHMSVQVEEFATAALNRYRAAVNDEFETIDKLLAQALVQVAMNAAPDLEDVAALDNLESSLIEMKQVVAN